MRKNAIVSNEPVPLSHRRYERDGVWTEVPRPLSLRAAERGHLLATLAYTGGDHGEAARLLGICQRSLEDKMRKHRIPRQ